MSVASWCYLVAPHVTRGRGRKRRNPQDLRVSWSIEEETVRDAKGPGGPGRTRTLMPSEIIANLVFRAESQIIGDFVRLKANRCKPVFTRRKRILYPNPYPAYLWGKNSFGKDP
jgi:hypothetical protein